MELNAYYLKVWLADKDTEWCQDVVVKQSGQLGHFSRNGRLGLHLHEGDGFQSDCLVTDCFAFCSPDRTIAPLSNGFMIVKII